MVIIECKIFLLCLVSNDIKILNVTTLKYSVLETKMDNRLKKDFHELLNDILSNMACVVTDSFNIEFNEL